MATQRDVIREVKEDTKEEVVYTILYDKKAYKLNVSIKDPSKILSTLREYFLSKITRGVNIVSFNCIDTLCEVTCVKWKNPRKGTVYYPYDDPCKVYTLSYFIRKIISLYKKGKDIHGYKYIDLSTNEIRELDSYFDMKDYVTDGKDILFDDIYFDLSFPKRLKIHFDIVSYLFPRNKHITLNKLADVLNDKIKRKFGLVISVDSFIVDDKRKLTWNTKLDDIASDVHVSYILWDSFSLYGKLINSYTGEIFTYHERENRIKTLIYNSFLRMVKDDKNRINLFKERNSFPDMYPKYDLNLDKIETILEVIFMEEYGKFFEVLHKSTTEACNVCCICLETPKIINLVVFDCLHTVCFTCFSKMALEDYKGDYKGDYDGGDNDGGDYKIQEVKEIEYYDNTVVVGIPMKREVKCPLCRHKILTIFPVKYMRCHNVGKVYNRLASLYN